MGEIQHLVNNRIIILETNDVGKSFEKPLASSKYQKEEINPNPYWNPKAKQACEEAEKFIKHLQN